MDKPSAGPKPAPQRNNYAMRLDFARGRYGLRQTSGGGRFQFRRLPQRKLQFGGPRDSLVLISVV
jgi:hypothetical protein